MMKRRKKNMRTGGQLNPMRLGCAGKWANIRSFGAAIQLDQRIFHLAGIFYFDWDVRRDVAAYSAGWPQGLCAALPRYGIQRTLDVYKEDDGGILAVFRDVLDGQCAAAHNYEIVWENGTVRWYRVNAEVKYDDAGKARRALAVFTDITELRKKQLELFARTQRDSLTDLYNKVSTEDLIVDCIAERGEELHALFFLDIDNFKMINDSLGHLQGDRLLELLAAALRALFRPQDILGRVGGDEFIVFCVNIRQWEDAARKAGEIIKRMQSVRVDSNDLYHLSVSIGISIFDGNGQTFMELYEEADLALYEAKRRGKNQYAFYSDLTE